MHKTIKSLSTIKLIGITARTSNAAEMNPNTAKIGATLENFFKTGIAAHIKERKNPGTLFAVYTDYENKKNGQYTYFLGEEVNNFDNVPQQCEILTIPAQTYVKITSEKGPMPTVCIAMWKNIWEMTPSDLGGERSYKADFEIYDERSNDPLNTILDIYIGIK